MCRRLAIKMSVKYPCFIYIKMKGINPVNAGVIRGKTYVAYNHIKIIIKNMKKYILNLKRAFSTSFPYFTKDEESKNQSKGYTKPSELYPENGIEYGRNFGKWKCLNCEKIWTSAYTWISTDFCLNNNLKFKDKNGQWWYNGKNLSSKDFILEQCKDCTINSNAIIKSYHKLKPGDNDNHEAHHSNLCAKCNKGFPCQDIIK